MSMSRDEIGQLVALVTWLWGQEFVFETDKGNFLWYDPYYKGNNHLHPFEGSLRDAYDYVGVDIGRDKRRHVIKNYAPNFILGNPITKSDIETKISERLSKVKSANPVEL